MKKKRGLLLFLMSVVSGAFLYIFVDMLKAGAEPHGITLDISYWFTIRFCWYSFDVQFLKEKQKISLLVSRGNR